MIKISLFLKIQIIMFIITLIIKLLMKKIIKLNGIKKTLIIIKKAMKVIII